MTWKGIDVSEHNGVLNWQQIKDSGIQFAIIRCSWGHFTEDTMLRRNVSECERVGMPYGLYHYSYVSNQQEKASEAASLVNLIKQFKPLYPVYIDMEDADGWKARMGVLNDNALHIEVCRYTCEAIQNANFYAGIYANLDWWTNHLNSSTLDSYAKWLAQWASAPTYNKPFGMWQYTSDGSVPGSSARTDMNIAYVDYPTAIKENHLNNSDGSVTPTPPPAPEPSGNYGVGDVVSFHTIYTSSTSTTPLTPVITSGTITQVIAGARNPYLINNGTGWINDASINGASGGGNAGRYSVGDVVSYNAIFSSSTSTQALTPAITSGKITRIISGARNPYLINDGTGWVNDSVITTNQGGGSSGSGSIVVGSNVRVKQGAKDYNGTSLAPFVYNTTYKVMELSDGRAVIGLNGAVTAAVHTGDLYLV